MAASSAGISEIVNAIGEVFNGAVSTIGNAISQIVDSVGGLATAIGGAISGVLDSVAGIFDSIGNAAINAGTGMQSMVDAIGQLMGMDVFAMGASLASAADGVRKMVDSASGAAEAASSMEYLNGLLQSVMNRFSEIGAASTSLQSSASGAASAYSTVVVAISSVVAGSAAASAGFAVIASSSSSSSGVVQASSQAMIASLTALPGATSPAMAAFSALAASLSGSMASAQAVVSSACSAMESRVSGMRLHIPSPTVGPLPKFGMSGSFNPKTGAVPSVYVYYAAGGFTGGFTNGPIAIAGEAGTEAIISFDPKYRDKNIGYWMMAGQMLGVLQPFAEGGFTDGLASDLSIEIASPSGSLATAANAVGGGSQGSSINFGGVTFAPQITVTGSGNGQDIMAQLKSAEDDFFDMLDDWAADREEDYAPVF